MQTNPFKVETYPGYDVRLIRFPQGGAILIRFGLIKYWSMLIKEYPLDNDYTYLSDI